MALDHGRKTIGVAISDAERRISQPLTTIRRGKQAQDIEALQKLVEQQHITALIIGYPLEEGGKEGRRCQSVRAFVRAIEPHLPHPMLLWDERYSSKQADEAMRDAALSAAKRADKIDASAAAVILDDVLRHLK